MNKINLKPVADDLPDTSDGTAVAMPRVMWWTALVAALFASAISLGINVYAGMLRAGTVTEQICTVATSLVAALCMYLAPMLWRFAPTRARVVLAVLWLLAVCGVLRGQVDVLAFANVHAADERAQTVAVVAVPSVATGPAGRNLMAIEQDIAKVSIEMAHVDARRCMGECRSLRLRKAELSAQLAVLNAEADEAKRRATEQDWRRDQVSRAQELSESRRAEPGTALVAPWLGTTEARLDLLMNFVLVVVLEGTACYCWYVVGLGAVATRRAAVVDDRSTTMLESPPVMPMPEPPQGDRDGQDTTQAAGVEPQPVASSRAVVASERNATVSRLEVVAPIGKARLADRVDQSATHAATLTDEEAVVNDASPGVATPDDDRLVAEIREAVVAGRLKRNLMSIRAFVGCAQSRAVRLNRLYVERFGKARSPEAGAVGAA
ncbi:MULTISPECIES: hypothetical protein [Burkholderia cepacia complex]|uniref:hypothetical protein n=1 Tax=Burkholderia cepacia complex TaxID=87882 RepID=UPI000052E173|nr:MULTISPECIES: hypothetical protein [Burkholderia cepacia complex]ABK06940.1 conserved hypothetical protein [Burkholderia cenocepacia HI2424]MBJ9727704.1 hypothetical protein [Burkholderia cenocepacia]MDN7915797.1 hypothetical protein [Burkholderia cepacia]MDR5663675.1 hypothetical protein [Burkholderia cenocepacia]MDR8025311.1 hypothetical protein [Burkholderia cenocepacia]